MSEAMSRRRFLVGGATYGGALWLTLQLPRPRAAALALGGGGFGGPASDPAHHVHRIAPRPILFVNATRDETIPRSSTEALYAAAADPKEIQWFDSGHLNLPGDALKAMWQFIRRHLDLPDPP